MAEEGVHNYSSDEAYVQPDDPLIRDRLEWFRDLKLGIMMHWGPYSQLGIVESWALSDEDAHWSRTGVDWTEDGEEFKRQYFDLNRTFNPIRFRPDRWASAAAAAGFKYLIFTTKHHDGFCMWDTHLTDYKVTGKDCPFHTHKYADICKHLFEAFRNRGLAIAAYFSKADWHTPYYWAPGMARGSRMWRGPSYDPEEYPWLWERFVEFTHEQIMELITRYGRIDILWLDAGWVGKGKQDIRLGEVVARARKVQPWLITADRTVGGLYENYITPEQTVPPRALHVPWESCITMGESFSFKYGDRYKSFRQLVLLLIEVVAKGGNLALNVGPQPDGRLPEEALSRMEELGAWLAVHGEAIYGTRICEPYFTGDAAFTRKDASGGAVVYGFKLYPSETVPVPESVILPYRGEVSRVDLVGGAEDLPFSRDGEGLRVALPLSATAGPAPIAHVFRLRTP